MCGEPLEISEASSGWTTRVKPHTCKGWQGWQGWVDRSQLILTEAMKNDPKEIDPGLEVQDITLKDSS